jgi:hypothetical protein
VQHLAQPLGLIVSADNHGNFHGSTMQGDRPTDKGSLPKLNPANYAVSPNDAACCLFKLDS